MTNGFFSSYTPLPRHQNARAEAVNAIFDAVIVGFDGVPAAAATQQDRVTHCTDTGSANAYAIAPTYAIVSYVAGQHYSFVATNANTTASTVNVSGLGVKTIKRQDGTDLSAGDIASGQMVEIRYDGTNFQLLSMPGGSVAAAAASATSAASSLSSVTTIAAAVTASATQAAASATTAGATVSQWAVAGGTADAITGAFPTAVTSLTDGLVLGFRASAANATTTPTFKADGTTAHTITKQGGTALVTGDIPAALAECIVRYNLANTRWELQNPAAAISSGTFTPTDASGASLTLTSPVGYYRKTSGFVHVWGSCSYPATADASAAKLGGLPFTSANLTTHLSAFVGTATWGGGAGDPGGNKINTVAVTKNATTLEFRIGGGAALTNANAATNQVDFYACYPI